MVIKQLKYCKLSRKGFRCMKKLDLLDNQASKKLLGLNKRYMFIVSKTNVPFTVAKIIKGKVCNSRTLRTKSKIEKKMNNEDIKSKEIIGSNLFKPQMYEQAVRTNPNIGLTNLMRKIDEDMRNYKNLSEEEQIAVVSAKSRPYKSG